MDRYGLGVQGEQLALEYLVSKNYKIVARNISYPNVGEIDIIAMDGQTMVFVEVRTRSDNSFGNPLETLTKAKLNKIVKASRRYILEYKPSVSCFRYDVIAVLRDTCQHIENAFYAKW